ncbi:MAG: hypothetical protein LBF68_07030 [Christensenellaceae bacterium]|jgi:hypothetical protein|nr:hypothetical protein [Christensenellaceae bacterium]
MVDFNYLIAFIVIALLGLLLGFGRILKIFTSGPFGFVLSIVFCALLGGTLQTVPVVANFIVSINDKAIDIADFLKYLRPGIIVYYITMFLIVQIFRIFIVKAIRNFMETDRNIMRFLNRILGMVSAVVFSATVVLLFFAVVEVFDSTALGQNIISKIGDGIIRAIYDHNPINFVLEKS